MSTHKLLLLPGQVLSLLAHPANRDNRSGALKRWLAWQIGARLVPGPVATPFVDETQLLTTPGAAGATGNIHFGLAEYEDMAFALHFLRPRDLFVDVGANIGAYSILAVAAGATVIAFEPVAQTATLCERNIRLNDFTSRVVLHRTAIGAASGAVTMTNDLDAMNRVAEDSGIGERVLMETLDDVIGRQNPALIKIDVEGYEHAVLRGAARTLELETLRAVIIEINGAYGAYGLTRDEVEAPLRVAGFSPFCYAPRQRELTPGVGAGGNVIFIRDVDAVRARLKGARRFKTAAGFV